MRSFFRKLTKQDLEKRRLTSLFEQLSPNKKVKLISIVLDKYQKASLEAIQGPCLRLLFSELLDQLQQYNLIYIEALITVVKKGRK